MDSLRKQQHTSHTCIQPQQQELATTMQSGMQSVRHACMHTRSHACDHIRAVPVRLTAPLPCPSCCPAAAYCPLSVRPQPPAGMSTEPQTCHLVVSVLQRSYVSTDKFPCSMKTLSAEELDDGCCYNAGGMGRRLLSSTFWAGRNLLSSWEKAVWNRRAMLH